MTTNLSVDPDLIDEALKISGEKSKTAVVTKALKEFIARRRQKAILDLAGKLEWNAAYHYKKGRSREWPGAGAWPRRQEEAHARVSGSNPQCSTLARNAE